MNIEHKKDENNVITEGTTMMPGMTDLQTILVADRRDSILRDGAALRAERERDHRRSHAVVGTDAADHRADLAPPRVRLGRWLVNVGEAIAGPRPSSVDGRLSMAASATNRDDPGDGHDGGSPTRPDPAAEALAQGPGWPGPTRISRRRSGRLSRTSRPPSLRVRRRTWATSRVIVARPPGR